MVFTGKRGNKGFKIPWVERKLTYLLFLAREYVKVDLIKLTIWLRNLKFLYSIQVSPTKLKIYAKQVLCFNWRIKEERTLKAANI